MRYFWVVITSAMLVVLSCGNGATGPGDPEEDPPFWSDYNWISYVFQCYPFSLSAGYAIRVDSIYFMMQPCSSYMLPESIGVGFVTTIDSLPPDCWVMDLAVAFRSFSAIQIDDYYQFEYPYWLSNGPMLEPVPLTSDSALGGLNNVIPVFYGEYDGDTTIIVRKLLNTLDPWDLELVPGSSYWMQLIYRAEYPYMPGWIYSDPVLIPNL